MKSFYLRGMWSLLGLIGLVQPLTAAEPFGSASLLPMPSMQQAGYQSVVPTSYGSFQEEVSPSDQPTPAPTQAPGYGPSFAPPPTGGVGQDYQHAMKQSWDAPAVDESCGNAMPSCGGRPYPRFYVYGGGLVLGRAGDCGHAISQSQSTYQTIMNTNDAGQQWAGGFEGRIGYVLGNGCNAIEARYWGLFPGDTMQRVNGPGYTGGIGPMMGGNLNNVYYNDGTNNYSMQQWMTTSTGFHEIERSFNYNSVDINFLGNTYAWGVVPCCANTCCSNGCGGGGCCRSRFQFGWLAGFRYFNLNETFAMYSDYDDQTFDNDPNQTCYHIRTNNTLLGFQMGGQGNWCVTNCFSLFGGARFGVYNNHATSFQEMYGSAGQAVINSGSYAGTPYYFNASQDGLATLGEIDLGGRWQMNCHWSLIGGYRVVGISGVATGPGQISNNFASPYTKVCASDSVILHGAFGGVQYAW